MRIERVVSDLEGKRSPSALTRQWCRLNQMTEGPVETWKGPTIRSDLFGFADHVAFDTRNICFIQSTSASNRASRVKKVLANQSAGQLCQMGARILVVTWQRKDDKLHYGTVVELDLSDFAEAEQEGERE
ncbi:hypothetical protein UFOVP1004_58 [uncultured Caudovirales phage]|uniref:Uncharacterized protein n=1 Tax=uncultured Caudovirales phage TaxID=2100421 RepID=A0A6J5Q6W7_9CAUD|nr:hypothetical protein UFOVP1004_58 [uncultured Caudovirales phage]